MFFLFIHLSFFYFFIHPFASSWKTFYQELNEFLINNAICLIDIKEIWGKLLFPLVQKKCLFWLTLSYSHSDKVIVFIFDLWLFYTILHQNIEINFMYSLKLYFQWKLRISLILFFSKHVATSGIPASEEGDPVAAACYSLERHSWVVPRLLTAIEIVYFGLMKRRVCMLAPLQTPEKSPQPFWDLAFVRDVAFRQW